MSLARPPEEARTAGRQAEGTPMSLARPPEEARPEAGGEGTPASAASVEAGGVAERPGDPGTLLFENDRIRVWELIMRPGEVCNWHVHAHDHLLVVVDGAHIAARKADGSEGERDIPDGTVLCIPASPVAEIARNISTDRTLRELIIDLKDPAAQKMAIGMADFFRSGTASTSRPGTLDHPGSA